MTLEESYGFRQRYFNFYKGVHEWQQNIMHSDAKETRTILGRRRMWTDIPRVTELLNSPIQGTAADIIKEALVSLTREIENTDYKIVGCVHDEIILEVPERSADRAATILTCIMEQAGSQYLKNVPVAVDFTMAHNWSEK